MNYYRQLEIWCKKWPIRSLELIEIMLNELIIGQIRSQFNSFFLLRKFAYICKELDPYASHNFILRSPNGTVETKTGKLEF